MTDKRRNQFDKKDSLERGDAAEEKFRRMALERGWQVSKASSREDIDEHWEYQITKDNTGYKVDVKAAKRIRRSDKDVQYEWVWLELHGVRSDDRGWIYDGKADLIAFEMQNGFLFVEQSKLIDFIDQYVQKDVIVTKSADAKYKVYNRRDRLDRITLLEAEKLRTIMFGSWTE